MGTVSYTHLIGLVGTLLAIVGAVLYVLERTGHPVVSRLGKTCLLYTSRCV